MIAKEDLIAAGYKPFASDKTICDNTGYQKAFRGADGNNLYFVEVYIWYFAKHFPYRGSPEIILSCEACLYLPEGNPLVGSSGFTVTLRLGSTSTIPAIEAFYANVFAALDCVPDLHND